MGDLACCGVELMVVVAVDFFSQHAAHLFHGGELFVASGAHDAILQPPAGSLYLAFGLR